MLENKMEQLFLEKPKFDKNAGARKYLGQESTVWVRDIITTFLSEYPELQSEPLTVQWEKTDFDKGFAIGKINIRSTGITVPIVIREWILMPLDVINKQGSFLPLNEFTSGELFTEKQPFKAVHARPKKELMLFTGGNALQFSPTGATTPLSAGEGSSITRDAVKVGSFIDHITNIDVHDVENLLNEIKEGELLKYYEINETDEIIEKLGTVKVANVGDDFEALVRDLDLDISYIFEDSNGNKFLKQANSKIDYTWETQINDDELSTLKIKAITNEEEIFKFASYEVKEAVKESPEIGDCGYFKLGEVQTPQVCIVNITKPVQNLEKHATFLCGGGYIAINENKDYYLNDKDTIKTGDAFGIKGDNPDIGDYGVWIVGNRSTSPFEIESIYKSAVPGEYEIVGNRGITKVGYYPIKAPAENLIELDKRYNSDFVIAYYVPGNAKFIKLSKDLSKEIECTSSQLAAKITSAQNEYGLLKIAGFNATSGKYQFHVVDKTKSGEIEKESEYEYDIPLDADFITSESQKVETEVNILKHVYGRDSTGLYYFSGPEFIKYSETHSIRDLSKEEAIWTMLHCRGSEGDIKNLTILKYNEEKTASTNLHAPVTVSALASTIENAVETFDGFMPLRRVLVKQASAMKDKTSVDAMLSLGLINRKNLLEYISMIPNYEVVLSELSELLLMARMGLSGIEETAIEESIEALSQVVKGLKEVQGVTTLK